MEQNPDGCTVSPIARDNTLNLFGSRAWQQSALWFTQLPLEKIKAEGISFGKVVCLAHCVGAKVEALRTNQSNIDDFRRHVITCSTSDDCHLISSYSRVFYNQARSRHFFIH